MVVCSFASPNNAELLVETILTVLRLDSNAFLSLQVEYIHMYNRVYALMPEDDINLHHTAKHRMCFRCVTLDHHQHSHTSLFVVD